MRTASGLDGTDLADLLLMLRLARDTRFGLARLAPDEQRDEHLRRLTQTIDDLERELARRNALAAAVLAQCR